MGVLTTLRSEVRKTRTEWEDLNRVIAKTPTEIDRVGSGPGRPLDRQSGAASFLLPPGTVLSPTGQPVSSQGGGRGLAAGVMTTSSPSGAGVRTTSDPGVPSSSTLLVRPLAGTGPSYTVEFLSAVGEAGTFAFPSGQTLEGWYYAGSFYPVPREFAAVSGRGSGGSGGGGGSTRRRPSRVPRAPQALDRSRDYVGPGGRVIREGDSGGGAGRATAGSTVAAGVDRMRREVGSKLDRLTAVMERGGRLSDALRRAL